VRHWNEDPVIFRCGAADLVGVVHRPHDGVARLGVLIIVGGPQYRVGSHRQFTLMARALARSGFAVMRFDYRGMGDSDGSPRTFETVDEDLHAAIETFFRAAPGLERVVLWGLCDAASAILMHAPRDARVSGFVLANPWVRSVAGEAKAFVRHYYLRRLLQRSFWAKVLSGESNPARALISFLRDVRTAYARRGAPLAEAGSSFVERMRIGLQKSRLPILLLMSERDLTASEFDDLANRDPSWRRALSREGVQIIRLAGADHTFSERAALELATTHCNDWLRRIAGL
jgi:exosortase A-associated hydrolase 1